MTLLVNHIENADNKNFYEEEDKKSGRFEGTHGESMKFLLRSFFFSFTVMLTLAISSRIYLEVDFILRWIKILLVASTKILKRNFARLILIV